MTTVNAVLTDSGAHAAQSFVINLCSSTSPMALAHPTSPELKRYTFFVSRQRQDGRDRFRLHMGYFDSQEQAEQLLELVRDVYPAAWASPAPAQGGGRRARIAPTPTPAPAPAPTPAPPPASASLPALVAVPTLEQKMSEMRNVLSMLDDEAPAPDARGPQPPVVQPVVRPAVAPAAPVAQPAPGNPPRLRPVAEPKVAAAALVTPRVELTPAQALSLLETAPSDAGPDTEARVRVLTPEDTQTLRDIKVDKANNAPPSFAVQLVWSVTPIDSNAMPHLAIFDAYTLYNVEGSRQGRKWYGLRLGFFSDPNSATQVANYVRGDYRSVAVVPVSTREMDRAGGGTQASPADSAINPPLKPTEQFSTNSETMTGFELVEDDRPPPPRRDLDMPREVPTVKAAKPSAKAPGKPGKPTGKRATARKKPDRSIKAAPGAAAVLESTLDILGASTLTIDDSKSLVVDEAAGRRAAAKPQNNKFSKLLSRLGGG